MRSHRPIAVLIAALIVSALGCSDVPTTQRCDEPDNSCNRAFLRSTTPLSALRDPNPMRRVPEGTPVDARNLQVTAYDELDETMDGDLGTVYVQETIPPGNTDDPFLPCPLLADRSARICGISTFNTQFNPLAYRPKVGDLVDMSGGQYDEFDCSGVCGTPPQPFPDGRFLPQVREPTIRSAGVAPLPTPVRVTVADLMTHNAALIGVLVEVSNVTVAFAPDRRGEIQITSDRNGPKITQEMVTIPGVVAGTQWSRVVGVVSYFYGPKLIPRTLADLTPAG
ncbi:MAG: hypothetical protein IPF99_07190 [Deltaproteobacteria bacterium]|nr:hypothetical protein [Deltaproteobacteria bacterium]